MIQELITSFLLQSAECNLPGLGSFSSVTKPARLDVANKIMFPPEQEFVFSEKAGPLTGQLVKYIAYKLRMGEEEVSEKLRIWSKETRTRIESGGSIALHAVGKLSADARGNIILQPEKVGHFYTPSVAERVIHKESGHSMLVGDKQTTSREMKEILNPETEEGRKGLFWKIAALILFLISAALIFFHYYHQAAASNGTGNRQNIHPASPPPTYISK